MKRISSLFIFLVTLQFSNTATSELRNWGNFYDEPILSERYRTSIPDIQAIFEDDIPSRLTLEQRKRLVHSRIEFPQQDTTHPMNFRAEGYNVIFPVSSIQFLRDITLAYAWLSVNEYDLQPISDYLVMIRYQWPSIRQKNGGHTPLKALGIPENAASDKKVNSRFQQLFGAMIVFIQGHELGHVYYQHAGSTPRNEILADQFGLALVNNFGEVPIGVGLFFHIMSHLDPFPGDEIDGSVTTNPTHPLSTDRLHALINDIERNKYDYSMLQNNKDSLAKMDYLISELRIAQSIIADRGAQRALRYIGRYITPEMLKPRKPGSPHPLEVDSIAQKSVTPIGDIYQ